MIEMRELWNCLRFPLHLADYTKSTHRDLSRDVTNVRGTGQVMGNKAWWGLGKSE